jgi:hypothetical protein
MKDWRRYQDFDVSGTTNPNHYEELSNFQKGLRKNYDQYNEQKCDDDDDHPNFAPTLEKVRQMMDAPIKAPKAPNPRRGIREFWTPEFPVPTEGQVRAVGTTAVILVILRYLIPVVIAF